MTYHPNRREIVAGALSALTASAIPNGAQADRRGRMFVSIRDDILMTGGYASVAEGLKDAGVHGVEIAVSRDYSVRAITPSPNRPRLKLNDEEDVKSLGDQLGAEKIKLSAFLMPTNFNATDIDSQLEWVTRVVQVAHTLGAPAVRVDSIMEGLNDTPREQRQEIFARGVHRVLDATPDINVGLAIENHGTQGNDPDFLEGLFKAVSSRRLGLTMDVGNFYWAGYPIDQVYDILHRLAPHAMHTHIKNIAYPAEMRNTRREPGYEYGRYVCPIPDGDLDIRKIAGFLRNAGYHNDLCIEDESLGKFDQETRRAHIRQAVGYLQGMV